MIPPQIDKDLLRPQEVAARLSVTMRTLRRMVERGDIPQPIRFTCKLVRWRTRELLAHVDGLPTGPPF